eukprot:76162-Prymnesium_polylepis.1
MQAGAGGGAEYKWRGRGVSSCIFRWEGRRAVKGGTYRVGGDDLKDDHLILVRAPRRLLRRQL